MENKQERIQKLIAQSGLTSRRKAEQLIIDGKVKVNDKVVTKLGTKASRKDLITVNDIPIEKERKVYFLLYKPRGYISAVSDDRGRKTVIDLLPEVSKRIYPIGRLDYNTSGILLLTNDGDFAHRLMHPKFAVEKQYNVKVEGIVNREKEEVLLQGVEDQGDLLKVKGVTIRKINKRPNTSILKVILQEGKNRHIRRLFNKIGHPVLKLKREKFAFLTLQHLQPGDYRALTAEEVNQLKRISSQNL